VTSLILKMRSYLDIDSDEILELRHGFQIFSKRDKRNLVEKMIEKMIEKKREVIREKIVEKIRERRGE
jgi:hypothetical protein